MNEFVRLLRATQLMATAIVIIIANDNGLVALHGLSIIIMMVSIIVLFGSLLQRDNVEWAVAS